MSNGLVAIDAVWAIKDIKTSVKVQTGSGAAGMLLEMRQRIFIMYQHQQAVVAAASLLPHPHQTCLLYTSPSPRDKRQSRMPSSA